MAEQIAEDSDLDIDPADNFDDLVFAIRNIELLLEDDDIAKNLVEEAETSIASAIEHVRSKKDAKDQDPDVDWDWYETKSRSQVDQPTINMSPRSIFSDVDE